MSYNIIKLGDFLHDLFNRVDSQLNCVNSVAPPLPTLIRVVCYKRIKI